MLLIGGGVLLSGYTLTYWGLSQISGGNWGLLDVLLPSKATAQKLNGIPKDGAKTK